MEGVTKQNRLAHQIIRTNSPGLSVCACVYACSRVRRVRVRVCERVRRVRVRVRACVRVVCLCVPVDECTSQHTPV